MKNPLTKLDALAADIVAGHIGTEEPWGGADVCVVAEEPKPQPGGFYPDPYWSVTRYVGELSWLCVQLRNIAWKLDGFGYWKYEFFTRFNVAASTVPDDQGIQLKLLAAVREAYGFLGAVVNNEPLPDVAPIVFHPREVGADIATFVPGELVSFYADRGIDISGLAA